MKTLGAILALALYPAFAGATGVYYDALGTCDVSSGGTVGAGSSLCFNDPLAAQSVCIDSSDAGKLRFAGSGGTNDEDIIIDTETTADTIALSSGTGVASVTLSGMTVSADNFEAATAGSLSWPSKTEVTSPTDGWLKLMNDAGTAGVCLNTGADTLNVYAQNCSTFGPLNAYSLRAVTGNVIMPAGSALCADGNGCTTKAYEKSNDVFAINVDGVEYLEIDDTAGTIALNAPVTADSFEATTGDVSVTATNKVCLDGTACTSYLYEHADDDVRIVSGNGTQVIAIPALFTVTQDFRVYDGNDQLDVTWERIDATVADGENVFVHNFVVQNDAAAQRTVGTITATLEENAASDEDISYDIQLMNDGSLASALKCDMTDGTETCAFGFPVTWPALTVEFDRRISAANVGATAPSATTIGQARCLQFAQATTAETAHIDFEVPSDWDGVSDFGIELYVFPVAGDAPADTEVVEYTATYRSVASGELYDYGDAGGDGSATSIAVSYTQSGAGVDKGRVDLTGTIDYDDANQPLTAGDQVYVVLDLNETNTTYSGDPILCNAHLSYTSIKPITHR